MNTLNTIAAYATPLWTTFAPFALPFGLWLAYQGIGLMQAKGYHLTYATAVVRAAGAGISAAQAKGLDPFSGPGLAVAADTGAKYLMTTVPTAAAGIGITELAQHATVVEAQIKTVGAQAVADAQAAATVSTPNLLSSLAVQVANGSISPAAVATLAASLDPAAPKTTA
jgi:hypothetical protein